MARPLRTILPNHTYHTYSRCHNLKNLLKYNLAKELLVEVINNALDLYDFNLISYAIMDNHFHFIIQTTENGPTISTIMQYIKSQYARKYNNKTNRTGALWNERFGSTIVEFSDNPIFYLNWLIWYLGYNPVRSGDISDPREYSYSSINSYLEKNYTSKVKITLHKYFIGLGETFKERIKKFKEYEDSYRKRLYPDFLFS